MDKGARIVRRFCIFDRFHNSFDVMLDLILALGEVAKYPIFGYSVMEEFGLEEDSGQLFWEALTECHLDLEHPTLQVGHGSTEKDELPYERVLDQ